MITDKPSHSILLVFFCSFIFYIFLYKLYKYLFRKAEMPEVGKVYERKNYFKYDSLVAGILFLLLTLLYFYPCLRSINTYLIGPPEDNMAYLWNMWWAQKAVAEPAINLSFSNYLYYPEGSSLLCHFFSFYNLFLSIALRPFINNPVLIYNLLILHTFVLSGIGAFLLIRYLTKNSYLSLIGAFIFAFNPSHFAHALHHLNISSIQFIPFFVLFFIKAVKGNSKKDLFLAGLFFFLNSICSWYYLFFAICFIGFSYIYMILQKKQLFSKDILLKIGIIIVPTLLILSPWLIRIIPFMKHLLKYNYSYNTDVADIFGLILPHPYHWLANLKILHKINLRFSGNNWEKTVYLGIVNISIMALTFKSIMRKNKKYFLGFLTFLILSMGTSMHILGWRSPIMLPYNVIRLIPLFSTARCPSRMIVYAYLFLAVIVTLGLKYLIESYKPSIKKNCLLGAFIILLFFDYYSTCSAMTRVGLPRCYNAIKTEERVFGILDLPGRYAVKQRYMMYQTYHGFPIVQGAVSKKIGRSLVNRLESEDLLKQKKQLIADKVKYIIIHKNSWWHSRIEEIVKRYTRCYKQIYEDKENALFQVY